MEKRESGRGEREKGEEWRRNIGGVGQRERGRKRESGKGRRKREKKKRERKWRERKVAILWFVGFQAEDLILTSKNRWWRAFLLQASLENRSYVAGRL